MGLGSAAPRAQPFRVLTPGPASPSLEAKQSFEAKIDEQARALANEPRLRRMSAQKRRALVEFMLGNMLFVATHEMGRALLAEMKLPAVTGQEEAADDFAVLTVLQLGERDFSDRVLIEAAKGWFVSSRRKTSGRAPDYYAEHAFTARRGYRIVCLMIGADPARFGALGQETKLPDAQRRTCGWQYDRATRAWERVLVPYRRAADRPKARIDVIYGAATGRLAVYAQLFRNLRFLETIAGLAADRFAWPAPIAMEMQSCGKAEARWIAAERRLLVCYETAEGFARVGREVGRGRER